MKGGKFSNFKKLEEKGNKNHWKDGLSKSSIKSDGRYKSEVTINL